MWALVLIICTVAAASGQDHLNDVNDTGCRQPDKIYQQIQFFSSVVHEYDVVAALSDPNESSVARHKSICVQAESDRMLWFAGDGRTITPKIKPLNNPQVCGSQPFRTDPGSGVLLLPSDVASAQYENCVYEVVFDGPNPSMKGDPHIIIKPTQPGQLKNLEKSIQAILDQKIEQPKK
jgi:hypothetical protein